MRKATVAVACLILTMVMSACGSGSGTGSGDKSSAARLQKVQAGFLPIANDAPLYVAVHKGFFEKEGLQVELVPSTNFGAGLASVLNGEYQFGFGSSVPILIAKSKGAALKVVAGQESIPVPFDKAKSPDGLFAKPGTISSPTDLSGKTVALNALGNINELAIREAISKAGGDPGKTKFIEMAYPDMVPAVESGRVDAAALVEPFTSAAKAKGLTPVDGAYWVDGLPKGALIDGYFTSEKTLQDQGPMVEKWVRAMGEATAYAREHPDEVRRMIATYAKIDPSVAAGLNFYDFSTKISDEQITDLVSELKSQAFISTDVAPKDILG